MFINIGNEILNEYVLCAKDKKYRICEIEFYMKNAEHNDEYVHCAKEQKNKFGFYFHKYHNGTFKSGTWKGMDLCFGDENTFYGVLIRSMLDIETNEFIEGPCKCANTVLNNFNCSSTNELYEQMKDNENSPFKFTQNNDFFNKKSELHIEKTNDMPLKEIYWATRIGLSDKYPEFKNKLYRYCTHKEKIKKEKKNFCLIK